ncbi:phosphoadenosine phosphosulfate reductase [Roseovarius sp. EL26]|uniref:phosphoadenosine phosphosulfate reductase n=1 Tax=Roseovarius sp. EL26 TaxID=2126672 RepID=UPI000EA005A0|nr:phosphoadenosine phosphosulfate reductase [Roseovarius sp. EL26]
MHEPPPSLEHSLGGLQWQAWLETAEQIADEDGYVEYLGKNHAAILIEKKPTLLVTFESFGAVSARTETAHPLGWSMVRALGWSHLCLMSKGDTWFRDDWVYGYFDRLIDDGFFEDFEQVIFYGAGPCGYAAAAFSVSAPGAKVLLLQPQATLAPELTEWDDRFRHMRRTDFSSRYAYAPDMIEAAETVFLLYDPAITTDAMHAALFNRPNVVSFRTRFMGAALEAALIRMDLILRILAQMSSDRLSSSSLARLCRARHGDPRYQLNLLRRLRQEDRHWLITRLCRRVLKERSAPLFRTALEHSELVLNTQSIHDPQSAD